MVTYHVVQHGSSTSPSLHALVKWVKLLTAQLEIMLEVVHVPGNLVIHHGVDSLSQGLWPTPCLPSQPLSLGYLFGSVTLTEPLLTWV
eukprot:15350209-Ditylum_brightwellii.AAC.1